MWNTFTHPHRSTHADWPKHPTARHSPADRHLWMPLVAHRKPRVQVESALSVFLPFPLPVPEFCIYDEMGGTERSSSCELPLVR